MIINFEEITPAQRYFAMVQSIIPRPIAWVLTPNGSPLNNAAPNYNLAPYSFFTGVCSHPPLIMLSAGKKPTGPDEGEVKDTAKNIIKYKSFVVHIASAGQINEVNTSSQTLDYGQSEIDHLQLVLTDFDGFHLPRLKDCKIAMACDLYRADEIGHTPQTIIYGEIKQLFIADDICNSQEYKSEKGSRLVIDPIALNPLARLGGNYYAKLGETLTVKRPE